MKTQRSAQTQYLLYINLSFLFILRAQSAEPKILETYSKLAMKDAMDFMRRNPSNIGTMSGTESMSALFRNYTAGGFSGRLAVPPVIVTAR